MEESDLGQIKSIMCSMDYKKMEVTSKKTFYLGRSLNTKGKKEYVKLVKGFLDVFSWAPLDCRGISLELGEDYIDLVEGIALIQ